MSAMLIVAGAVVAAVSGVPALLFPRGSRGGALSSTILLMIGAAIGAVGALIGLAGHESTVSAPWSVPGGALNIRVDALSAFFVAPVFLIAGAGALFGERYWPASRERAAYVRAFYGILAGALAIVMTAANTILFLAAWEIVALASFFLVATEGEERAARDAAWLYLAASHVATLSLFGLFAVLHAITGTWTFTALSSALGSSALSVIFWLAVVGFGIKAGLMPLHVWLPSAHAAAPSHVSAMMSGVVIKMGIYGLVRVLSLFSAPPPWFGETLLIAGVVSSILGVAFALAQHDLKRLLAYHSIENIGIIVTGLGVGLLARAHGHPAIALLGFGGALLHVWNHGLFKSLLFLGGGAAVHSMHTREIDRMGGLARRMPWSAAAFLVGAVAICGLPPLNGFVSEWLLYMGSFAGMQRQAPGAWTLLVVLVAPALAVTGALALACFVKAFGAVFLGSPRTEAASAAEEVPPSMRIAMAPLAIACMVIGIVPTIVAPALARAVVVAGGARLGNGSDVLAKSLVPLQTIAIVITALLIVAIAAVRLVVGNAPKRKTWDCGYAVPTPRMQYTSSSFARTLVAFFRWVMPAVVNAPRRFSLFPLHAEFETHMPDTVLDRGLMPSLRLAKRSIGFVRYIQNGRVQLYLLYVAATLVLLLVWSSR
jgi:hydrogenase-4 component B